MALKIYLCSAPEPPFPCRFFAETPALVMAHLTSHAGINEYQRFHGHHSLAAIPRAASLLLRSPAAQHGVPVWICTPCSEYFTSNLTAVNHLHEPEHAAETEEREYHLGIAGFYEFVRNHHGRILVPDQAGPAPVIPLRRRLLAVNFTAPYPPALRMVAIPAWTATRGALAGVINAEAVDWTSLWADGLVVRYITADGVAHGLVLRTDEHVGGFVAGFDLGECWIGDGRAVQP